MIDSNLYTAPRSVVVRAVWAVQAKYDAEEKMIMFMMTYYYHTCAIVFKLGYMREYY